MHKTINKVLIAGAIVAIGSRAVLDRHFLTNRDSDSVLYQIRARKRTNSMASLQKGAQTVLDYYKTITKSVATPKTIKLLRDFADNDFLFVSFSEGGYGILNVAIDDVVQLAPFSPIPFDTSIPEIRYVPWMGFYEASESGIKNSVTKKTIDGSTASYLELLSRKYMSKAIADLEKERAQYNLRNGKNPENERSALPSYPISDGIITADHEVPNSWYFKRNIVEFPHNGGGICGYVAASMLLAYNEIFNSTGYFSASETAYLSPYDGVFDLSTGTWDGVPDLDDAFPQYAWGSGIGNSVPSTIHSAIDTFMAGKNKEYEIYDYVSIFSNIYDPISDGCPAAYFGYIDPPNEGNAENHVVTVYGYYNNGNLLVHYGWEYHSQVVMSRLGVLEEGGVVAIYNKAPHVHNTYFSHHDTGSIYCGCGCLMVC